jgi:hypothetical protein
MPDYNPAVALGLHPPENSLAQTFNTIANLQQSQAHTGLYTLQAAQQQRDLDAKRAYADTIRGGGSLHDAAMAAVSRGGNTSDVNQLLAASSLENELKVGGGLRASAIQEFSGAAKNRAEIGKIGVETNKLGVETQTAGFQRTEAGNKVAMQHASMFLANPDQPEFLQNAIDAHMAANPPANKLELNRQLQLRAQILAAPKDQQIAIARGYGSQDPTTEQKNAVASGMTSPLQYETAKKISDTDVTQYGKVLSGLSGQANTAAAMLPNIQMTKALINDPGFYSGTAEGTMLAFKKAAAALRVSEEDAAVPQEAFRKVMAANILHQVDDIKAASAEMGQSTSRIFASQIDLMEKAAQNPDNSVAGNRFLAEVQERAANRSMKIGDMAADYKLQHGKLDEGFIKDLRKWSVDNPMFTKQELANPKSLAAPPAKTAAAMPKVGESRRGYTFKGGNPADQSSWEKE